MSGADGSRSHGPGVPAPPRLARIMLRPMGSPIPLGFLALGSASVVLSGLQLGWLPTAETHQVGYILLALVAPLQFVSATFGFLARDSVAGTGMALLGGTWLGTGVVLVDSTAGSTSKALGMVLLYVGAALMVPAVTATFGKLVAAAVIGGAAVRFALTGAYELTRVSAWERASGWWGLALCLLALYGALAFELEDTRHHTILPTGRRGEGRAAIGGDMEDDLMAARHAAGVREQL